MTFVTLPISTEEGASPPGLAGGAAALMGRLNGFLQPRRLRRYQSDLFDRGQFAIRDPRDGAERLCDGTICSADKAFAWRFPSEWGELWLTSAGPTHGYEIESVFDPATGRLFLLADRDPRLAHNFARHIQAAGSLPPGSGQAAWLLVGHANFAHFLWNEASALLELETRTTSGIAGVLLSYEPVLPFATLFDWPAAVMRRPVIPGALHGHALGFHVAPIFAVGATRISLAALRTGGDALPRRIPAAAGDASRRDSDLAQPAADVSSPGQSDRDLRGLPACPARLRAPGRDSVRRLFPAAGYRRSRPL